MTGGHWFQAIVCPCMDADVRWALAPAHMLHAADQHHVDDRLLAASLIDGSCDLAAVNQVDCAVYGIA